MKRHPRPERVMFGWQFAQEDPVVDSGDIRCFTFDVTARNSFGPLSKEDVDGMAARPDLVRHLVRDLLVKYVEEPLTPFKAISTKLSGWAPGLAPKILRVRLYTEEPKITQDSIRDCLDHTVAALAGDFADHLELAWLARSSTQVARKLLSVASRVADEKCRFTARLEALKREMEVTTLQVTQRLQEKNEVVRYADDDSRVDDEVLGLAYRHLAEFIGPQPRVVIGVDDALNFRGREGAKE